MRTSGAANDKPLAYVPIVAAVLIALVLLGGPSSLLQVIDRFLANLFGMVVNAASAVVAAI
jgi:flagellar biosynthesis protein FliQ